MQLTLCSIFRDVSAVLENLSVSPVLHRILMYKTFQLLWWTSSCITTWLLPNPRETGLLTSKIREWRHRCYNLCSWSGGALQNSALCRLILGLLLWGIEDDWFFLRPLCHNSKPNLFIFSCASGRSLVELNHANSGCHSQSRSQNLQEPLIVEIVVRKLNLIATWSGGLKLSLAIRL